MHSAYAIIWFLITLYLYTIRTKFFWNDWIMTNCLVVLYYITRAAPTQCSLTGVGDWYKDHSENITGGWTGEGFYDLRTKVKATDMCHMIVHISALSGNQPSWHPSYQICIMVLHVYSTNTTVTYFKPTSTLYCTMHWLLDSFCHMAFCHQVF